MRVIINFCVLLFLVGCMVPGEVNPALITNVPVSSNVPSAYSYVVSADYFTGDQLVDLQFDSSSFVLSLVVMNHAGGNAKLEIYNADSSATFVRDVTSSVVISEFPVFEPERLSLKLSGFTGKLTLSLAEE